MIFAWNAEKLGRYYDQAHLKEEINTISGGY
jgi:hypothetical protein